jgi:hypothetical protein
MTNIENQSGFEIANPGPQVAGSFNLPLVNSFINNGNPLTGTRNVSYDIELYYDFGDGAQWNLFFDDQSSSVAFSSGIGFLSITQINNTPGDGDDTEYVFENGLQYRVTVTIAESDISGTDSQDIYFYQDATLSGFTLPTAATLGTQYVFNPFDIAITGATDVSGANLTGRHKVTVTSSIVADDIVFNDSITFSGGNATIPDVILENQATHDLTVSIDWVKGTQAITGLVVNEGVRVLNESSTVLTTTVAHDFGSLTAGYTQIAANTLVEIITIERMASTDITGISVTDPTNYDITQPSVTTLDGTTPTTTFTIKPKLGLAAATYNETITVEYTINANPTSQQFNVTFAVEDSYSFTLQDEATNSLGSGNNFTFTSQTSPSTTNPETITITNTGTGQLTNVSVGLSGVNAADFALGSISSATINSLATATFTVTHDAGLTAGAYEAIVTVSSEEGVSHQFFVYFTVSASGLQISTSPAGTVFLGILSSGYSAANAETTIVVTNTGTTALNSSTTVALSGGGTSDFVLAPSSNWVTDDVLTGDTIHITVSPDPGLGAGLYEETITINPNGTGTANQVITVQFLVDDIRWAGSVNSSWSLASNWVPHTYNSGSWGSLTPVTPNRFVNILIPNTTTDPVLSGTNVRTSSMEIQSGGKLTVSGTGILNVDAGGTLTIKSDATTPGELEVSNFLINNGTVLLETISAVGGRLTVKPTGRITSSGTITNPSGNVANFVVESASTTSSGSVIVGTSGTYASVQRWLVNQNFHMISSPVIGQEIQAFINNNPIAVSQTGNVAVRKYSESSNGYEPFKTNAGAWGTELFEPGVGYAIARSTAQGAQQYVTFQGQLRNATVSFDLTRTSAGWNLVGNPFSSSLAVKDFLNGLLNGTNRLQLEPGFEAIYIYDHSISAGSRYFPVNNASPGYNYVASGQGFFVRAKETPVDLDFAAGMRAHQTTSLFKSAEEEEPGLSWSHVGITLKSGNKEARTLLAFNEYMTSDWDITYDAVMYDEDPDIKLFTRMPHGYSASNLGIQALPEDDFSVRIPVGVVNKAGGNVTFGTYLNTLPYYLKPLVYDAQDDVYTDISLASYTVGVAGSEPSTGRFYLRMQDSRNQHTFTYKVNGMGGSVIAANGSTLLSGGEVLQEGSNITFTAQPWNGYRVLRWTVNGIVVPNDSNTYTLRLLEDAHVTVSFVSLDKTVLDVNQLIEGEWDAWYANREILIRGIQNEGVAHLIDLSGRVVMSIDLNGNELIRTPVTDLQDGVYFIRLVNNGQSETKRLYIR